MPTHTLTHSHTHGLVFLIALILFAIVVLTGLGILWILCWIAKGEPDTNGDPERDAVRSVPVSEVGAGTSGPCSSVIPDSKFFTEPSRQNSVPFVFNN
jgi:hypothetical protein